MRNGYKMDKNGKKSTSCLSAKCKIWRQCSVWRLYSLLPGHVFEVSLWPLYLGKCFNWKNTMQQLKEVTCVVHRWHLTHFSQLSRIKVFREHRKERTASQTTAFFNC